MPAPATEIVRKPQLARIAVALEPVHHFINSLSLLIHSEHLSGYAEWVTQTAVALTPHQLHMNKLVLEGLHYAVVPNRSWSTVEAYLANLAAHDPVTLRDRLLDAYEHKQPGTSMNRADILASADAYLDYLYGRFPKESVDEVVEREAYALMIDPPQMQQTIVTHLQEMWETIFKPEWLRVQPMLQASADAFNELGIAQMTPLQAARVVVGQELPEHWEYLLGESYADQFERIVFVPSAHIGPYLGTMKSQNSVWLIFGARLPEGTAVSSPDLSRSELLVRLTALADETRLRILQIIREEGEQCSQDIINRLGLSQSAASRHLKQLSATGYLLERRRDGAKCYRLNQEKVDGILQALSYFLDS